MASQTSGSDWARRSGASIFCVQREKCLILHGGLRSNTRRKGGPIMPILGALVLVIQLCFAYHAYSTGRPRWWLAIIMAFPVMGCVAYYFIEVFPTTRESRKVDKAVRALARSFD